MNLLKHSPRSRTWRRLASLPILGLGALCIPSQGMALEQKFSLNPAPTTQTQNQPRKIQLPSIGESSETFLSSDEEQRLGDAFMRNLRANLDIIDDPILNNYLQKLGWHLVTAGDAGHRRFEFFIVSAPSINAFAGPGGYIGIHSGLFLSTEHEGELAGVLAHEIAHVTQRHLARAYQEISRLNLPLTAAVITAIILGNQGLDYGLAEAAIAVTTAGSIQHQINFTRNNEKEADRIGLQILADGNFDPRHMPAFFGRLQRSAMMYDNQQLEFLRTHPVTHSRIADTEGRAEQFPKLKPRDESEFKLMQTRLRILTSHDLKKAQALFEQLLLHPQTDTLSNRYGAALTSLLLGNHVQAARHLEQSLIAHPESITLRLLQAKIKQESGQFGRALAIHTQLANQQSRNPVLAELHAQLLIETKQFDAALSRLQFIIDHTPRHPQLHKLLAQAYNGLHDPMHAHESLAQFHYINGNSDIALKHLNIALKHSKQTNEKNRLKARISQWQQEQTRH